MKYVFLLLLCTAVISGCGRSYTTEETIHGNKVYKFGTGQFRRINIDGVDCVIGAGSFDHTAAVSCDWATKDK
jgi:hypothetical protein